MNSRIHYLFILLFSLIYVTCAPEENSGISMEDTNEFTFDGQTYNLISAVVYDENTTANEPSAISVSLYNKTSSEIVGNNNIEDVTYVYFNIEDVTIQNTTYTQIDSYDVSIDGAFVDSTFNSGTVLLSDSDPESDVYAQSTSIDIINFTQYNINFTFTFTRNDGKVISGSYNGNYLNPNN